MNKTNSELEKQSLFWDIMCSFENQMMFWRYMSALSSGSKNNPIKKYIILLLLVWLILWPWRWWQHVSLKRYLIFNGLHNIFIPEDRTLYHITQFYIPEENAPYSHSVENSNLTKIKFHINELRKYRDIWNCDKWCLIVTIFFPIATLKCLVPVITRIMHYCICDLKK